MITPTGSSAAAGFGAVALCLFILQPAAAAPEQRCTDLGGNCVCSEPMDVKDGSAVQNHWNPSDSTKKQCEAGEGFWGCSEPDTLPQHLNPKAVSDLDFGGMHPPSYVLEQLHGYCDSPNMKSANTGARRRCARWYERFGKDYLCAINVDAEPSCGGNHITGKMFDTTGTGGESTDHQLVIQAKETTDPYCGAPGHCGPFQFQSDDPTNGGEESFTFQTMSPDKCRADANGKGGWCRMELCIGSIDHDLTTGGNRYYEVRVKQLSTGLTETIKSTHTRLFNTGVNYFRLNAWNNQTGETARIEFSHFMEASYATDSGQWIGPAIEIEGSDGS